MHGLNDINLLDIPQVRFLIKKNGLDAFASLYALLAECKKNLKPFALSDSKRNVIASDLNLDKDAIDKAIEDCVSLGLLSVSDGSIWLGKETLALFKPEAKEVDERYYYPFSEVMRLWNETCCNLPKVLTLNNQRKLKMRQRFKEWSPKFNESEILGFAKTIFLIVASSDFLNGKNERNWCASFDWIFSNEKNCIKVYEGNYNNRTEPNKFDELANLCNYIQ